MRRYTSVGHRWDGGPLAVVIVLWCAAAAHGQGYAPEDAVRRMTLPVGWKASRFASEPEVRQPILVKVDERGRLWTIQYLQYPNPAGLKRVAVDRWSRTRYDRVPEPPPAGPRGADRITIMTDRDGDGRADTFHDFLDGLNLATGLAFGHGGVYVLQAPYLLFYPDADRDDVPDGDPAVLLRGFGMEDAQSLANHLTWGPDGWLYGVNGSTTTCRIRDLEFQQGVWRYHPRTDRFELFCEGGGNTFGLTFDEMGNLFYSTNGGPFVHALQGAYYYKSFGKHGPLHNRYAYGHFPPTRRDAVPGGPPTGGTIYLGTALPDEYRGGFLAGNFLGHGASWWRVVRQQTTFRADYRGDWLRANDTWFGATDLCAGPAGELYVCDFHDRRTSHPDPDAEWDRSNGRIYRITAGGNGTAAAPFPAPDGQGNPSSFDLAQLSSSALVDLLRHPNRWFADRARVLLAERRDPAVHEALRAMASEAETAQALQGLWGLYVSGGFDLRAARGALEHEGDDVRVWAVRLLADTGQLAESMHDRLLELAARDPSPLVRCQLAASARRLPGEQALPLVKALLDRDLDRDDPRIPLLVWWALEAKAVSHAAWCLDHFAQPEAWENPSNHQPLRWLARRWAAEGRRATYDACARLLASTPPHRVEVVLAAIAQGLSERAVGLAGIGQGGLFAEFASRAGVPQREVRQYEAVEGPLLAAIQSNWEEDAADPARLRLALLAEAPGARQTLLDLTRAGGDDAQRIARLELIARFGDRALVPVVLARLNADQEPDVQRAALAALRGFDDARVAARMIRMYPRTDPRTRTLIREILLSRPRSAAAFLKRVDQGEFAADEVPVSQVRAVALHQDPALDALVRKHWGNVRPGTEEEKLATMRRYNNDLRTGKGDVEPGRALFRKHCAPCHRLFGEGTPLGPDLTNANRLDRAALLANLVDPSAVVRRDYLSYVVQTRSGQVLTGLIAEQDAARITLRDAKNQRIEIARDQVESLQPSTVSLMPERILDPLTPQERRDLFAYLQQPAPATALPRPRGMR